MAQDRIQAVVDRFADELGRSVVVNDPEVRMLYASPHFGDEDAVRIRAMLNRDAGAKAIGHVLAHDVAQWSRPGRIPALDEVGLQARVAVPVRWRGEVLGMLMIMDADGSATQDDLDRVAEVAAEIAPLMGGDARSAEATHSEATIAAALDADPAPRGAALRELAPTLRLAAGAPVRVVALAFGPGGRAGRDAGEIALRHAVVAARSRRRGEALHAVAGDVGYLVHTGPAARSTGDLVGEARTMIDDVQDVAGDAVLVTAGVGDVVDGLAEAWVSARQARLSATVAGRLGRDPVAAWEDTGVLGLLARIPSTELDVTAVPAPLRRLAAADPSGRLTETLRAFLDHAGSGPAASEALFIHRTTLYYRLDRIRDAAAVDLDDGAVRLQLHLGLHVVDLMRADGRDPFGTTDPT
ncbi:CdaR family transcriptional regulator [Aeromicrobium sp. Root472D3]|uniref:PucR family transcriptional regulator n=1 Tax=Aeromicrobium sp. Root472D3 TaxID=1736540 RepID=UPI0006F6996E|nr:helix-turn-helix domain-containing protein [Aeromicrobium sp. Root472D3]KQX72327.1 transcriptional regulator [Aeromicrobium sp. Root472D3]